MEKQKIDMSKYADMHKEEKFKGTDDIEITVRDHIPYEEKENMARELIEMALVIHDDSCVYLSNEYDKIKLYLIAKYYTDIDTEDLDPSEVANYLINTDVVLPIQQYTDTDVDYVEDIFYGLYDALDKVYTDDNSLAKAVRKSFGFLFNGKDITETLAEAEAMKDKTFEAFKLLHQSEKEKAENLDNGTLTIGGNVISFAKKED